MATQNQIDANRRNAQKSTGPKTPEGRAAVRLNGIKHGLTARALVLEGEKADDFEALFDSIQAEHQPTTPLEVAMVRRIAMATWRLLRAYHIEAGFFVIRRLDLQDQLEEYTNLSTGDKLAFIVLDDTRRSNALDNISRYEGRLERSLDKALRELQRSRSVTYKKMQNQSQSAPPAPEPDPPSPSAPVAAAPANPQPTTQNQQLALGNRPALSYTLSTFSRRVRNETTRPRWRQLFGFGRHSALGSR